MSAWGTWTSHRLNDTSEPQNEAISKAAGLMPPMWQHHRKKRSIDLDHEMEPRLLLFKLRINQSDNLGRKDAELLYGKQSVL